MELNPNLKTAEKKSNFAQSKEKSYTIIFKDNRSYDLHIGKSLFKFGPKESKDVPEWVINHKDFENASKYFVIKENN